MTRIRKLFSCVCLICNINFSSRCSKAETCKNHNCQIAFKLQPHPEEVKNNCSGCGEIFICKWQKRKQKTCSKICSHLAQAISVSETMKLRNPMKRKDVALKMSKTRSARFKNDPSFREKVVEYTRKAWADGKYEGVNVGKCKWYDHICPDGAVAKCQGTWEVALARRFDELNIQFQSHRGRWSFSTPDHKIHSYYPDFYVPMWDVFIDVKGAFWDDQQRNKISYIIASNLDKNLIIANKSVLDSWNVDVKNVQDELLIRRVISKK